MSKTPSTVQDVASVVMAVGKANPTAFLDSYRMVLEAASEWKKVTEVETTKRTLIDAQRQVMIEKIQGHREVMVTYLNQHFAQTGKTIDGLFERLDTVIEKGDTDQVAAVLGSIVDTVKTSPLGDLATLDQRLADDSFTFKLGN